MKTGSGNVIVTNSKKKLIGVIKVLTILLPQKCSFRDFYFFGDSKMKNRW